MKFHRGRLIDHVHLHAADLAASTRFYTAVLRELGIPVTADERHMSADELWIDGERGGTRVHLAFQAQDRAQVERAYRAGLRAGGHSNGEPGERPYHPGYFAGFLIDPDGNNVEVVHHGAASRSARDVEIEIGKSLRLAG